MTIRLDMYTVEFLGKVHDVCGEIELQSEISFQELKDVPSGDS